MVDCEVEYPWLREAHMVKFRLSRSRGVSCRSHVLITTYPSNVGSNKATLPARVLKFHAFETASKPELSVSAARAQSMGFNGLQKMPRKCIQVPNEAVQLQRYYAVGLRQSVRQQVLSSDLPFRGLTVWIPIFPMRSC